MPLGAIRAGPRYDGEADQALLKYVPSVLLVVISKPAFTRDRKGKIPLRESAAREAEMDEQS